MNSIENRVKVDTQTLVDITKVTLSDGKISEKESFLLSDPVEISLQYLTREVISKPLFTLDIIRPDGVICCYSRTDFAGCKSVDISGKGEVKIKLGELRLAPGIYMLKFSIWDKEMIHAYTVRSKDVIRITMDGGSMHSEAVFLPKIQWDILPY